VICCGGANRGSGANVNCWKIIAFWAVDLKVCRGMIAEVKVDEVGVEALLGGCGTY